MGAREQRAREEEERRTKSEQEEASLRLAQQLADQDQRRLDQWARQRIGREATVRPQPPVVNEAEAIVNFRQKLSSNPQRLLDFDRVFANLTRLGMSRAAALEQLKEDLSDY